MAYDSLSAHQPPADDPFFNATPSNLEAESGSLLLDSPPTTCGSGHVDCLPLDKAADDHDAQDQSVRRPGHVIEHALDTTAVGFGPEAHLKLHSGRLPQAPVRTHSLHEITPMFLGDCLPSVHGNLQRQPQWGLVSPPFTGSYLPPTYTNLRDWSHVTSPTVGGDLPKTPIKQQESNIVNSPPLRQQVNSSQPKSVKHLTCWYWANKGCKLPDHVCLYSHFDTGRLAEPPVQIQCGRPAVAGKNASNARPVYSDWRGHHRAHSAFVGPRIQKQIEHIHAKAKVGQLDPSFAEPATDYNHVNPDDRSSRPAHPQSTLTDRGQNGTYGFSNIYGDMGNNGSGPPHFICNSPNGLNASGTSGPSTGNSSGYVEKMQKQLEVKDKVITQLAGLVELLEINYGISVDDQTRSFHTFVQIARSMEEESRETGDTAPSSMTKGKSFRQHRAPNVPAPNTSTRADGHPPTNHERLITAMEGSLNLIKMEKMILAKSNARKQVVVRDLEIINALKLLPRGWIER